MPNPNKFAGMSQADIEAAGYCSNQTIIRPNETRFPISDILKPSYYKAGSIECFDVIDAFGMDFYLGNVLKYISRWKSKGGVDDLRKARVYLDRRIEQAVREEAK